MTDGEPRSTTASRLGALRFVPAAIIAAGLALAYGLGLQRYLTLDYVAETRDWLRAAVDANLWLAVAAFLAFQVTINAFSFPVAALLSVLAGFLFGWKLGMAATMVGATAGGTLLFLAARAAFGGMLRRRASGIAARFADGFERDAFAYLLVLRLAPFVPFFMVSILAALFDVRLRTFLAATLLGIVPGAFAYTRLGEGIDSVILAARAAGREVTLADLVTTEITLAFSALALVTLIAAGVKRLWARRAP